MYFFIYETKNKINGNLYRGCHKTKNLKDGYLGSGILLKKAIKKYGKESFEITILEFCSSEYEMYEKEKEYVSEEFINLGYSYNLRCGGFGGRMKDHLRKQVSEKLKKPKSEMTKERMRVAQTGKKLSSETKQKIKTSNTGKSPSVESRIKMSEKAKNRTNNSKDTIWVTNGLQNKRISKDVQIAEGWNRGRTKIP